MEKTRVEGGERKKKDKGINRGKQNNKRKTREDGKEKKKRKEKLKSHQTCKLSLF